MSEQSKPEMITLYTECSIKPASGGFGEYESCESADEHFDSLSDLLDRCREANDGYDILAVGEDDLPEGVEDIRGLVRNQPTHIFATVPHDWKGEGDERGIIYFGIDEDEGFQCPKCDTLRLSGDWQDDERCCYSCLSRGLA